MTIEEMLADPRVTVSSTGSYLNQAEPKNDD